MQLPLRPILKFFLLAVLTTLMIGHAVTPVLVGSGNLSPTQNVKRTFNQSKQRVKPTGSTVETFQPLARKALPPGCSADTNVDYPGAIDCIVDPQNFDCNITPTDDCSFTGANRPHDEKIIQVVIHDTEGSAQSALNIFHDPKRQVSAHYIVDTDGTIYQTLHEHDIGYHAGNYWYNEHAIGIEHVGFDATGYKWYNTVQYQASAKLTAYLLKKYTISLDRSHVLSHGEIPTPFSFSTNHVDPGPYWLWSYYFKLVSQQGVLFDPITPSGTITLRPQSDQFPLGPAGTETTKNFNFFYLYNGPSTQSGFIPHQSDGTDITDLSYNVATGISYPYKDKVLDQAGTGVTMYQIWYGVKDRARTSSPPDYTATARPVWLAVPAGAGVEGTGPTRQAKTFVIVGDTGGKKAQIYGRPNSDSHYIIGSAPSGAVFATGYTVVEDETGQTWYQLNFNHSQAWLPASSLAPLSDGTPPAQSLP